MEIGIKSSHWKSSFVRDALFLRLGSLFPNMQHWFAFDLFRHEADTITHDMAIDQLDFGPGQSEWKQHADNIRMAGLFIFDAVHWS